ncbi:L,D-transpeptidase [Roseibium denhamense]|uniref:Lipoprotein-anchoring transpeptidase ErfK/SrfK n=1 Tax=Roseibium denhamense TaxID=76305 RepID=A0ABY1NIT5_9HYPH|nr:L,D-transpeptidase [Roseibium denhamense]MTI06702.1 L,D-transpeptidase [Roseibium denhamense]SMP10423.1 Lipoprotein-anchoring transpeptidase ErfK/SrfK [Roseibium denhamense]
MAQEFSRRQALAGGMGCLGLALAGCTTPAPPPVAQRPEPQIDPSFALNYGPRPQEEFPLPGIDPKVLPPQYRRQRVAYPTDEEAGSVVVDTARFYLYLVEPSGTAMRYGVGLGRQGFEWSGRARIAWKRPWPTWTPPDDMIAREPHLEQYSVRNGGMPPGLGNPLGARALYIFQGNVDTLYRLHGTNEPHSIGQAVSSGCVRLINQDVIDLYDRVRSGAAILVT